MNKPALRPARPHFSSGHDLRDRASMSEFQHVSTWGGFDNKGAEGRQAVEEEIYLGMCWRWRNLPKPTIAEVQGKVIAGGLMLVWVCDLIVASDDATFSDPVVAFGVNGVEYFGHPWELGVRKASYRELIWEAGKACFDAVPGLRPRDLEGLVVGSVLPERTAFQSHIASLAAEALGIRPETVKTRLYRARAMLRAALQRSLAPRFRDVFPFDGERCVRMADRVIARLGTR